MFTDYHNPNDYWRHNPMMTDPNIDPEDAMKSGCFVLLFYIVAFIIGIALCALFGSCTTTEYVTVEKVKHDTTYVSKLQRDSIWLHDSIYVKEWMKGDTVYRDVDRWHTKYIEKQVHDTLYQATHDTIPQPYPVIKEVEKQLSKRQKMVFTIGIFTIIAAACWFMWWAVKILRQFGILRI